MQFDWMAIALAALYLLGGLCMLSFVMASGSKVAMRRRLIMVTLWPIFITAVWLHYLLID